MTLVVPVGRRIGPLERAALALEIVRAYVRVRLLLARRRDVRDVVAALRRGTPTPLGCDQQVEIGIRLGSAVIRTLAVLPADDRCLVRSLALLALLERRGVEPTFVIGVRSAPFAAHAWLEAHGRPLIPAGEDYEPLLEAHPC